MKNIFLTVALTIYPFALYASDIPLACPTVDLVKQKSSEMDNAIPNDHTYIVTSKPVIDFKKHLWSVRTTVPARSQEDAIKLAQIVVKETSALMTSNAIKIFNQYGCIYFSPREYVYVLTDISG